MLFASVFNNLQEAGPNKPLVWFSLISWKKIEIENYVMSLVDCNFIWLEKIVYEPKSLMFCSLSLNCNSD